MFPHVPGRYGITERIEMRAGSDCWPVRTWRPDGYAEYGRQGLVHRIAWRAAHDWCEIPDGHEIHHKCLVRSCVNPAHLVLLTVDEHRTLHWSPADPTVPPVGECKHGHDWATHGHFNTQRRWICLECRRSADRRNDARRRVSAL